MLDFNSSIQALANIILRRTGFGWVYEFILYRIYTTDTLCANCSYSHSDREGFINGGGGVYEDITDLLTTYQRRGIGFVESPHQAD